MTEKGEDEHRTLVVEDSSESRVEGGGKGDVPLLKMGARPLPIRLPTHQIRQYQNE
jgi:hypothetical protein